MIMKITIITKNRPIYFCLTETGINKYLNYLDTYVKKFKWSIKNSKSKYTNILNAFKKSIDVISIQIPINVFLFIQNRTNNENIALHSKACRSIQYNKTKWSTIGYSLLSCNFKSYCTVLHQQWSRQPAFNIFVN